MDLSTKFSGAQVARKGKALLFVVVMLALSFTASAQNKPQLSAIEGTAINYNENDGAVAITSSITVTDVDNANMASAIVQITTNYASGQDILTFTDQNGITGSWDNTTGKLTLSGSATIADYETALRSITYTNTSQNPTTTTRTVAYTVNDGSDDSNTQTRDITVAAVNNAPVLAAIEGTAINYTENDGAVAITSNITVTDVDNANMASAIVQITVNYASGQDILTFTNQNGITGSWDNTTGKLTLSGSATIADYETALRSITYTNTSLNPTTTTRTVAYTVNDETLNSSTLTRDITVAAVNNVPVAVNDATSTNEDTPVTLNVTTNDTDIDGTINVATVDLDPATTGRQTTFSVTGQGTYAVDNLGVVTFTPVANYNGTATPVNYTVNDNSGATSNIATISITVNPVNDPPVAVNDATSTNEDTPVTLNVTTNDTDIDGTINVATVDLDPATTGRQTTFSVTGQGTYAVDNLGVVTFTPVANYNGTATPVNYTVNDNSGATSNIATISITVNPVNDPPVAINDATSTNEDTPVTLNVTTNDTDIDGTINVATVDLNTGSTGIQNTFTVAGQGTYAVDNLGVVTFTPVANYNGTATPVNYTVNDNSGATSNIATISITVNPVNDPPVAVNDAISTNEDTPVTLNVTTNDTDIDGTINVATVDLNTGSTGIQNTFTVAGQGTYAVDNLGVVTFTPVANYNGTATPVNYTVNDNSGATSNIATISITVNPVNDPPVAVNDATSTNEDTPVTLNVTTNDTDIDGTINVATVDLDPATTGRQTTFSVTGQGTYAVDNLGVVTFTPVANYNGTATPVNYTVNDNSGATSNIATISITVNPVNDPPVAVNDATSTNEDTPVTLNVTTNDTDIDGTINVATVDLDPATTGRQTTFSVTGQGTYAVDNLGVVTFTPVANYNGTATPVNYTVNDNSGATSNIATISITVNPVNDPPVAINDATSTNEDTPVTLNVTTNDTDIDGTINVATVDLDPATTGRQTTFSVTGQGTYAVDNLGVVTFTPVANYNGTATPVNYTVNDNSGATSNIATISITVNPVNDPPVAINDATSTNEDTPVTLNVTTNDTDIDGTINVATVDLDPATTGRQTTFSVTGQGTYAVDNLGVVTFTPVANYNGTATPVNYTVNDNSGATSNIATISITVNPVNDPPVAVNDATSTNEDIPVTLNVTTNDTDIDGTINVATVDLNTGSTGIQNTFTVAGQGTYAVDNLGVVTFTPVANYNGTATPVNYTVNDNSGATSNIATISITVNPVNDPPVAINDATSTNEDTPVTLNVTTNDTDIDGTINVATVDLNTGSTGIQNTFTVAGQGTYAVDNLGVVTFTPVANYNGTATPVNYTVNDNSGATSNIATISITVNPVNDPPVAVNDAISTNEDTPVTLNVTTNDTDIDGTINVATVDLNTGSTGIQNTFTVAGQGTYAVDNLGVVTFTPVANYNGTATPVNYTVNDNSGATSNIATISITVNPVNDPPVAVNDATSTNEDTPVTLNVTTNDTDIDGTINVATVDLNTGSTGIQNTFTVAGQGTYAVDNLGVVTFTPVANYNGTATPVNYTVNDNSGATSNIATISITVNPVNDSPVAVNDNPTMNRDAILNGDVSTNDSPSGDGGNIWAKATNPAHGTLTFNTNGTYIYTPVANYSGTDSFTYTITDVDGSTSTATVNITIAQIIGSAPLANNDNINVNEDEIVNGNAATNDIPSSDGGNVWAIVTNPLHGTATMNPAGAYTYSPNPNFNGNDSFTYSITDINADKSIATINITVISVNDPPVATSETVTTPEDTPINGTVKATDVDGNALTYSKTTDSTHGTATVNPDGTYTYVPIANYNGNDSFSVTVNDGNSGTTTATINIIVTPVNDDPVLNDPANPTFDPATKSYNIKTPEDTPINGTVKATDVDGNALIYSKTTDSTHGTTTVNSDGTYSYVPIANYNGNDSFIVTINDGNGGTTTATINIIVTPVNDDPVLNDPTNPTFDPATKSYNIKTPEDTPINGTVKATDVDGNALIYSKTTDSTHGTTNVNSDGTYSYVPIANYNGNDSFIVTINDGNGGTTTATINIIVTPVNDTPVAVNDYPIMNRDAILNGDVSTNDIPSGDGGNIWTKATNPSHGTLVFNTNGTYIYTPVANYSGSDSFAYTITDVDGSMSSAIVYITISQIIGAAPLANNDNITVNEDEIVSGNAASNDIPSSDGGNVWVIVTNPLHGTATMDPVGTYTYSPNSNYNGNDSFTYSITDINADKSIATVNITVIPVNDPPVATASPVTTMENTPVNGTVTVTDIDGDPLTFTKTTDPSHGASTVNADGTYSYTPTTGFNGNDSFTVTVNDGKGGKNTVTVNVTVTPLNNPPVINDPTNPAYNPLTGSYTVITAANNMISGRVNATDANSDPLTYSKDTDPTNGTASVNADGTYIYTPNTNYTGNDSFRVKVSDGKGGTATVIVNVMTIALPKITMKASKPVLSDNSAFIWTYTITINNGTNQKIDSVRIIDNLDNVFKDKGLTYEITSITASGSLWANGLFNGSSKIETLISDSSYINSNSKDSILIEVKVNPHNYVGNVHNQAYLNGYVKSIKYHFSNILSDDLNYDGSQDSTVTSIPQIDLFVPNAFSPNGDAKNQTFVITHSGSVKLEFEVFNRWGNSVYKNSDYQNDWNGKGTGNFLGQDLPSGTYYCIYKAINISTGAIENKGLKYITLRR